MMTDGQLWDMTKKNDPRTTITLTARARELLLRHRNAFGQKNVISVGLELFDALDDSEKIRRVSAAEIEDRRAVAAERSPFSASAAAADDTAAAQAAVEHVRRRSRRPDQSRRPA